jgi:adenosylmethionine-8-amino-7-oxononanoate aminotransferase
MNRQLQHARTALDELHPSVSFIAKLTRQVPLQHLQHLFFPEQSTTARLPLRVTLWR